MVNTVSRMVLLYQEIQLRRVPEVLIPYNGMCLTHYWLYTRFTIPKPKRRAGCTCLNISSFYLNKFKRILLKTRGI